MRNITITKDMVEDKYYFSAEKDNGKIVTGSILKKEIEKIIEKVEALKSVDEKKEEIISNFLKEEIKKSTDNIDKLKGLVPRFNTGVKYVKDDLVEYNNEFYRFKLKEKVVDYDDIPNINSETWEKVSKVTKENENEEYTKNYDYATFWNRDETFKAGTYVKWINNLYKASVTTDNAEPGRDSRWILIPKVKK
ncbi:hypothetical protein ABGF49_07695 [Helcococcus ovis]|uniref:hypothetical protein n=1 Tax=Helcococcus TaxID=31983 RepID=UPI0038BB820F